MFKLLLSSITLCVIVLFLFISITINCNNTSSTNPQASKTLSDSIQGKWIEPEIYSWNNKNYHLIFNGDSFYLDMHDKSPYILTYDDCYATNFTNYVAGKYSFKKPDSLVLSGVYTDSVHVPRPQSSCSWGPRLSGNVTFNFKYLYSGDTLILNDISRIVLVRM
jgi:hypothetical protein